MTPDASIGIDVFLPCLLTSTKTTSDWIVYETNLVLDGHTLTEISALCYKPKDLTEETTNTVEYFALLEHISIKGQEETKLYPPASSWIIEANHLELVDGDSGSRTLRCKLEWRLNQLEESVFTSYNVCAEHMNSSGYRTRKVVQEPRRSEKVVFLGTAHVDTYYVYVI